jgi:hypothetical protein
MHDAGCPKVVGDNWKEFGEKVVAPLPAHARDGRVRDRHTYRPKRGTVLIWHENLLQRRQHAHGYLAQSRRSIVSHYFADGAIAFYDIHRVSRGNME